MKSKTLSVICRISSGGTPSRTKPEYYGGNIAWVKSSELQEDIISDTEEKISDEGLRNSSAKMVPSGTVLLAMYGANVGRVGILSIEAATNQAVATLQCDDKLVFNKYLFYFLIHSKSKLVEQAAGGAQQNINQSILSDLEIALPPLAEQRRIATVLDKATRLVRLFKSHLKLNDVFLQSIFARMFDKYCSIQHCRTLHEISSVLIDCRNKTAPYSGDGIPLIRTSNFKENRLDLSELKFITPETNAIWSARYQTSPGDIVYCREAPFGMAAMVPLDFYPCLGQRIMVCSPNGGLVSPNYLLHALNSDFVFQQAEKVAVGSTVKHLRVGDVEELLVPLPPLERQKTFSEIAERVERKHQLLIESERQATLLLQSIMQSSFGPFDSDKIEAPIPVAV